MLLPLSAALRTGLAGESVKGYGRNYAEYIAFTNLISQMDKLQILLGY